MRDNEQHRYEEASKNWRFHQLGKVSEVRESYVIF